MKINKNIIKFNFTKGRGSQKIKYIVIHDTGNDKPLATADAHYRYFNGGNRNASAHYFVDEKEVLQIIEDSDTAWHVGDGKGKYGITNSNSIGIEICINDGDYTTEIKRTLELVVYLIKLYNIPIDNVVRHYDASRKLCPAKLSSNNWAMWHKFKLDLKELITVKEPIKPVVKEQTVSSWANSAHKFVVDNGISDGSKPKDFATREEIWSMIERYDKSKK